MTIGRVNLLALAALAGTVMPSDRNPLPISTPSPEPSPSMPDDDNEDVRYFKQRQRARSLTPRAQAELARIERRQQHPEYAAARLAKAAAKRQRKAARARSLPAGRGL